MWKVTIKGLLAHKLRFVLTGIAVILGIAFLSGTLVLTATIENTFDNLFTEIYEGTDVQVRGVEPVDSSFFGETPRTPVTEAMLQTVLGVDGVAVASPSVEVPYAQIIGADSEPIGGGGPPTFGVSYEENAALNPLQLQPGSAAPTSDDQIVIDKGSADEGDLAVGDRATVLTQQPPKEYEIVGIATFGSTDSPLGATIVQFTLPEAQRLIDLPADQFSNIGVVAVEGVSEDELAQRIRSALSAENVEVVTGKQLTEESQDDVDQFLSIFNRILIVFAAVALFVSCFIIYNTFTIVVTQRTREMALLRAIGASTRQVTTSIILEALVVGVVASLLGFGAGILLAGVLKALLDAIGFDIPASDIVIPPNALIASLIVGTLVTVFSAIVPARKASRVPPVAAMRDVAVERRAGFGRRTVIGLAITSLGIAAVLFALFGSPDNALGILGVGVLAIFIGVFVLGPVIARPVSRVLGAPLPKIKGMTGTLARENAIRNPRRTAATASALMIGVALVGFITIFAASAKASIGVTLDRELQTDYVITAGSGFGATALSPDLARQVSELPEIAAATGVRYAGADVNGDSQFITAFDTSVTSELLDLGVDEGSLEDLTVDGVAVTREWADDNDVAIGDVLMMTFPASGDVPMTVQAIYEGSEIGMTGDFVMSLEAFDTHYLPQQRLDFFVLATLAEGVSAAEGREAIDAILVDYPTAELRDNAEFKDLQEQAINQVVNLVYGLLFLAVVIALIGIANTLALSIYERRRELGLLRAVGMSRSQVRSSVRWESVIIAVFGTLLGLIIGLFFGWSAVRAVREEGFTEFAAAPGQLLIVVVVAAVAGVLAAYFPARRASKLDILESIATE
ncbi:MAG: FtsX-like permease family protein [Acidimicrobiia bacterium]